MFIYTQYTHVVSYGATDVFGSEWQEFPGFGDWCASKGTVWTAMPKHVRWDLLFDFVGVKCHHLPAEKLNLTAAKTVARVHGCWCTVLWHGCFLLLDVQECFFFWANQLMFWKSWLQHVAGFLTNRSVQISHSQFLGRWLLSLGAVVSGHGECISEFAHVSSKTHQKDCCILLTV